MQNIITCLCFCTLAFVSFSQQKFFKSYSNNGHDFGEGILEHPNGGYVITGSSSSFQDAPAQAFLLRVDANGNFLWSRDFGGSESDWGRRVFLVNNHYYVAGYTNSYTNGSFDFYFFKTDTLGNLVWQKNYGTTFFEKLHSAAKLSDDSFILVGETYNTIDQVEDIYIIRVDSDGNEMWTKQIGTPYKDLARNIAVMDDNNIFIVGEHYDYIYNEQKALLLKIDADGNEVFLKTYGDNGKYGLYDITLKNNFIYAVGYNHVQNPLTDPYLYRLKTDWNGLTYGESIEQNQGTNIINCVTQYGIADKFYVAVQVKDASYPSYEDGEDVVIIRYNQDLFYDNIHCYPSAAGHDQGNQFIPTSDGGAILVGYNTYRATGGNSVILVKIGPNDDFPASHTLPEANPILNNPAIELENITFYPNPSANIIKIEGLTEEFQFQIMDLAGKIIQKGSTQGEIDLQGVSEGSYLLRLENDSYFFQVQIIKQ